LGSYSKAGSLRAAAHPLPGAAGDETLEVLQFSISKPWAGVAQLLGMGKVASESALRHLPWTEGLLGPVEEVFLLVILCLTKQVSH